MTPKPSEEKERPKLWDVIGYFTLRVTDSGLAPWTLVALFILGSGYVITRNLDSKDSLLLISKIGSLHGLAWIGWFIAFIEIPIAKWLINRARHQKTDDIKRLEEENEKAREMLKKHKQSELDLKG